MLALSPPALFVLLLAVLSAVCIGLLVWSSAEETYDLTPEERALLMSPSEPRSSLSPTDGYRTPTPLRTAVELWVDSDPSGSNLLIDYEEAGQTPYYTDRLSTGWYALSVERDGYVPRDTFLYLSAERINEVALDLAPLRSSSRATPSRGAPSQGQTSPRETDGPTQRPTPPPNPTADRPAAGTVRLNVTPAGTSVELDGAAVGVTPIRPFEVAVGSHTLSFSLDGYEPRTMRVDVRPGESTAITAALKPVTGTLSVRVNPWGTVYVDGALRARDTDLRYDLSLPPGLHRVRVVHPELGAREQEVEVQPGEVTSLLFDLNRRTP